MRDPFLYQLSIGKTLGEILFAPLEQQNVTPTVVDVGARNGMFLVPRGYAEKAHFIGFEPNAEEYEKLLKRDTDAMKGGLDMPRFKSEKFYDCALWREDGTFPFYITQGTGACTMMGPTDPRVMTHVWLDGDRKNYEDTHSHILKTVMTKCRRLDALLPAGTVIDFLKIDTEGADTAVLEGTENLLKAGGVLVLKAEFQFFPYYKNHQTFGDQQVLLNRHGFRLIGVEMNHATYTREPSAIPSYADRRLLYAGDAYYMRDPDRASLSAMEKQRAALACLVLGFNSLSVSLLREAGFTPADTVADIERVIAKKYLKKRIASMWNKVPMDVVGVAAKLKHTIS